MNQPTILFADNNRDFLETRAEFLKRKGYRVIPATDPSSARAELAKGQANLAILDIRLLDDEDEKDVSGLALAEAAAYPNIPKIVLTNFPSIQAVREALRAGPSGERPAIDFITKEEGMEAMLAVVQNALTVTREQSQATRWEITPGILLFVLIGAVVLAVLAFVLAAPNLLWFTAGLSVLYAVLTFLPFKNEA